MIQRVREYRRKKRAGEMPAAAGTAARPVGETQADGAVQATGEAAAAEDAAGAEAVRRRLPAQDSVYLSEGVLSFLLFSYLAP